MLLRRGVVNAQVCLLQSSLNRVLKPPLPLKEDGIFGPKTDERVRQFQTRKSLKPDGIVGPLTLNNLFIHRTLVARVQFLPSRLPPPQPPPPPGWVFNPLKFDPRDVAWAMQWQARLEWHAKPPPKGPPPPVPDTAPPSLSLPPMVKYAPGGLVRIQATPPVTTRTSNLPPAGGNVEVSFGTGVEFNPSKDDKPKRQNLELSVDFAQFIGIGQGSPLETEFKTSIEDNGKIRSEVSVTLKSAPIVKHQSTAFDFKLIPLIVTAIGTPFDEATGFIGLKGMFSIHPFGNGAAIEIGGKFGPKGKIATTVDNSTVISAYPLQVEGTAGLKIEF